MFVHLIVCVHVDWEHIPKFFMGDRDDYGDCQENSNKWTLELISSFSRPGLVKFNKIYTEKVN